MAFTPDERNIVCCSLYGKAPKAHSVERAKDTCVRSKGHNSSISSVAFSDDGTKIVSASNNIIIIWDAKEGGEYKNFAEHDCSVSQVKFPCDGKSLLICSPNNDMMDAGFRH